MKELLSFGFNFFVIMLNIYTVVAYSVYCSCPLPLVEISNGD
jgi:hypothetical protein